MNKVYTYNVILKSGKTVRFKSSFSLLEIAKAMSSKSVYGITGEDQTVFVVLDSIEFIRLIEG